MSGAVDHYQDAEYLNDILGSPDPRPQTRPVVYPLLFDDELSDIEQPEWLIAGVLPAGGLAVLYGQPGLGKTFIGLDWALSIAEGFDWQGREIRKGEVVYVCAEGWRGVRDRVAAWKESNGLVSGDRSGVAFLGKPIRLLDPRDVSAFGDSIEASGVTPVLIVIDTLARNAVGLEENNAKEMGQVVSSCDALRDRFNATVLLIHHATKGGGGFPATLRGSGALKGAVDMLAVVKDDNGEIGLSCEKQKDAPCFRYMKFHFAPAANSVVLVAEGKEAKQFKQSEMEFPQ